MYVRPELQALRDDDTPQRQAQADLSGILKSWRSSRLGGAIDHSLAAYANGVGIEHLPPLARLFEGGDPSARRLADQFTARFTCALRVHPWGQVPVPSKLDDLAATLVLAAAGNAALVIQAIDGDALRIRPQALTAAFSPGETHDHVLAGAGRARRIEIAAETGARAELITTPCELVPGTITQREGARQSLLIEDVSTTLVILRLQRRPDCGSVTREFSLADGAMVHQATANPRESRLELTAALLGRMGRSDAAPLLAAMAEEQSGLSLRWQALKESLGLDTAEGFAALTRIAGRTGDALAGPANTMRSQLLASYPELERIT